MPALKLLYVYVVIPAPLPALVIFALAVLPLVIIASADASPLAPTASVSPDIVTDVPNLSFAPALAALIKNLDKNN
jgi:hypothetical protein